MEGVWRLRAAMAKTGDQEKTTVSQAKGLCEQNQTQRRKGGEQEPGSCPASPGEQEGTLNVLVPPLRVVQRTVFLETHIDLENSI